MSLSKIKIRKGQEYELFKSFCTKEEARKEVKSIIYENLFWAKKKIFCFDGGEKNKHNRYGVYIIVSKPIPNTKGLYR